MPPVPDLLSFEGRVVLLAGALGPLGAAIARAFDQARAHLVVVGTEETVDSGLAPVTGARVFAADLTDPVSMSDVVAEIVEEWRRLDVLINAGGLPRRVPLDRVRDDEWSAALDDGVTAAVVATRAVVPVMRAARRGRIVSIASAFARRGLSGGTLEAATGGALIGLTRAWARELGPLGITANAVSPGFVDGDPAAEADVGEDVATLLERIPAGRRGRPSEVADVVLFVASDLASFMNGAVVGVDGGLLL